MIADENLVRLVAAAHDATAHVASGVSAEQLYREAAHAAEQRIPGPLGTAVAGVLAVAAESRRVRRLRGNLGEHRTTMALALAVLGQLPDEQANPRPPMDWTARFRAAADAVERLGHEPAARHVRALAYAPPPVREAIGRALSGDHDHPAR